MTDASLVTRRISHAPSGSAERPGRDGDPQQLMTVGQLSRRTGLSRKAIRELEGRGLIYTVGRSDSNYRLFDETALWCAETIGNLRNFGLTLNQIEQLHHHYRTDPEQRIDEPFNQILDDVRARLTAEIEQLQATVSRIDEFRHGTARDLADAACWRNDPCLTTGQHR